MLSCPAGQHPDSFPGTQVHIEKGVVTAKEMADMVQELENYGSRALGSRIVARAWVDPACAHSQAALMRWAAPA